MKTLVTGGTGFIGSAVVRHLLDAGHEVRALVRQGSDQRNLAGLPVQIAYGDLRDKDSLRKALIGCRCLYHVAAHYSLWSRDRRIAYEINVTGTKNILEAAGEEGVERIVYTSSVGTLGIPPDGRPGTETTPVTFDDMVGEYKKSKYLAEQEALTCARKGLPVVIVNPSAPVGPRDIKPTPTGKMIVDFLKGWMWAYLETGLNLIDVEDVAAGHLLAAEKGRVGEKYILGNKNIALREIFEILSRISGIRAPRVKIPHGLALSVAYLDHWVSLSITGRPPHIPLDGVRMARKKMFFDSSKAVSELGLPQSPVEAALENAVRWFRDNGYVR